LAPVPIKRTSIYPGTNPLETGDLDIPSLFDPNRFIVNPDTTSISVKDKKLTIDDMKKELGIDDASLKNRAKEEFYRTIEQGVKDAGYNDFRIGSLSQDQLEFIWKMSFTASIAAIIFFVIWWFSGGALAKNDEDLEDKLKEIAKQYNIDYSEQEMIDTKRIVSLGAVSGKFGNEETVRAGTMFRKDETPTTSGRDSGVGEGKTAFQPDQTWDEVAAKYIPEGFDKNILMRQNKVVYAKNLQTGELVRMDAATEATEHYDATAKAREEYNWQQQPENRPMPAGLEPVLVRDPIEKLKNLQNIIKESFDPKKPEPEPEPEPESSDKTAEKLNLAMKTLSEDYHEKTVSQPLASGGGLNFAAQPPVVNNLSSFNVGSSTPNSGLSMGISTIANAEMHSQRVLYDIAKASLI
jgi:hypothetical protein